MQDWLCNKVHKKVKKKIEETNQKNLKNEKEFIRESALVRYYYNAYG